MSFWLMWLIVLAGCVCIGLLVAFLSWVFDTAPYWVQTLFALLILSGIFSFFAWIVYNSKVVE